MGQRFCGNRQEAEPSGLRKLVKLAPLLDKLVTGQSCHPHGLGPGLVLWGHCGGYLWNADLVAPQAKDSG